MITNAIIKDNNNYSLKGSEAGVWAIEIIDNNDFLTNEIIKQLKQFRKPIYFNETNGKHWIFDFKIDNVWFESVQIDCNNMKILLNAYN